MDAFLKTQIEELVEQTAVAAKIAAEHPTLARDTAKITTRLFTELRLQGFNREEALQLICSGALRATK